MTSYKEIEPHYFVFHVNGKELKSDFVYKSDEKKECARSVEWSWQLPFYKLRLRTLEFGNIYPLNSIQYEYFREMIFHTDTIEYLNGDIKKWEPTSHITSSSLIQEQYDFLVNILGEDYLDTSGLKDDEYIFRIVSSGSNAPNIETKVSRLVAKRWHERSNYDYKGREQTQLIDEFGLTYTLIPANTLKKIINPFNRLERINKLLMGVDDTPLLVVSDFVWSGGAYSKCFEYRVYKLKDFWNLIQETPNFGCSSYNACSIALVMCEYYTGLMERNDVKPIKKKFNEVLRCFGFNTYNKATEETMQLGWSMLLVIIIEFESKMYGRKKNCTAISC